MQSIGTAWEHICFHREPCRISARHPVYVKTPFLLGSWENGAAGASTEVSPIKSLFSRMITAPERFPSEASLVSKLLSWPADVGQSRCWLRHRTPSATLGYLPPAPVPFPCPRHSQHFPPPQCDLGSKG